MTPSSSVRAPAHRQPTAERREEVRPSSHFARCEVLRASLSALAVVGLAVACGDATGPAPADDLPEQVAAGFFHSCGLTSSGATFCWDLMSDAKPVEVHDAPTFATLGVGEATTCGLTPQGAAYCWGLNNNGQLGDGTTQNRMEPTPVSGGLPFTQLATGVFHTCGLTASGAAYCWGWNGSGQLGDGTTQNRTVPTRVAGGLTFTAIDTYNVTTCALDTDGAAYCWGDNRDGQVGDGTTQNRMEPTPVSGGLAFTQLATGGAPCALTAAGAPYCWGAAFGITPYGLTPTAIANAPALVSLSGGGGHTCGLTASGEAYCWGWNDSGQLGDGTTQNQEAPRRVAGGHTFAQLSATGFMHTCGVTTDRTVLCWGDNRGGQLGDGTRTSRLTPTPTAAWDTPAQ
jgi:alpha-tubulin suppressor-like RCC1 family protein